ncbi:MAG: hypothetical protein IPI97_07145 [Nitrosomonas sp.]|nr:hypothetical protein [Nitrosomonas sp.]MBK7364766.1 hypothetical protein [Nitrosomonas sp.]
MNFETEMRARFGGFWNSLLLLLIIIIFLRFSAIELATEGLGAKLSLSLKLFFGFALFGVVLALFKMLFSSSNPPYYRLPASVNIAWGLKRGLVIGGILILIIGILHHDNFLGVLQPLLEKLVGKIIGIFG